MKHLLFLITLIITLTLGGTVNVSAAPMTTHHVGQTDEPTQERKDRLCAVAQQGDGNHEAVLSDASHLNRICSSRPQRLIPSWILTFQGQQEKLSLYKAKFYESFLLSFRGRERLESAPIHFDVASRYYVICLRHLVC